MSEPVKIGARAPSNIALIKYMGKKDATSNLPENGSLSLTLDRLCTFAEIETEEAPAATATWIPELPDVAVRDQLGWPAFSGQGLAPRVPALDEPGVAKVLRHLERVRLAASDLLPSFGIEADPGRVRASSFRLRTANTFPEASGIASSASAFAAVTLAAAAACARDLPIFEKTYRAHPGLRRALARLSRLGSGSSCRSFEGPWVEWEGEDAVVIDAKAPSLAHLVLVVSDRPKRVSSSQAHLRIKSSPLWEGRVARAKERKDELRAALRGADLAAVSRVAWREAWEMHSLFHTSSEPFSYWEPGTMKVLQGLAPRMADDEPPIVTLDAGPNVHLSVASSRAERWLSELKTEFPGVRILEDRPGTGAELIAAREGLLP